MGRNVFGQPHLYGKKGSSALWRTHFFGLFQIPWEIFDADWPDLQKKLPPSVVDAIWRWQEARARVFGPNHEQLLSVVFNLMQDDVPTVFISEELALLLGEWEPRVLEEELGIKAPKKPDASILLGTVLRLSGLGLCSVSQRRMGPREAVLERFTDKSKAFMAGK